MPIAVLISGTGTNLQAIIDAIAAGSLNAEIKLVVASRPDAAGLKRAEAAGLQTLTLSKDIYSDPIVADEVIATELYRAGVAYVIMAGYMRKVHPPILATFPERVINLHPALLPSFRGLDAIVQAYERGVKVAGITIHIANAAYDQGPILAQKAIMVEETWTLEQLEDAIHALEHTLYPELIQILSEGRVKVLPDLRVAIAPVRA
nr:phosphoribosylglycinamide formyltransferase [Collinsella sp. zg1085]